ALLVDADPNAEAFYIRQGAIRIGETPSESLPGRVLPLLLISLH
ncbi:N-acetyltransferase, partial [Salmonella enterica subsp. enterica serovar Newport]|nr:N-acetyltransferase [Salmonella enterica subsp. enterica serovar Newport]